MIVAKSNFILFMAEVVNYSAQTTSRTERIKIIVKSVEKSLDVKDVGNQSEMKRFNSLKDRNLRNLGSIDSQNVKPNVT